MHRKNTHRVESAASSPSGREQRERGEEGRRPCMASAMLGLAILSLLYCISNATDTMVTSESCGTRYEVVKGDSCWGIWTRSKMSKQLFRSMNPWLPCKKGLHPGLTACLGFYPVCANPYTVQRDGETCRELWNGNKMTKHEFRALNPRMRCKKPLSKGQTACLLP